MRFKMNSIKILIILFLSIVVSSCSKKNLNLPDASEMPQTNQDSITRAKPIEEAECSIQFNKNMQHAEIALAASDMRTVCGLTDAQVLNLARSRFN